MKYEALNNLCLIKDTQIFHQRHLIFIFNGLLGNAFILTSKVKLMML